MVRSFLPSCLGLALAVACGSDEPEQDDASGDATFGAEGANSGPRHLTFGLSSTTWAESTLAATTLAAMTEPTSESAAETTTGMATSETGGDTTEAESTGESTGASPLPEESSGTGTPGESTSAAGDATTAATEGTTGENAGSSGVDTTFHEGSESTGSASDESGSSGSGERPDPHGTDPGLAQGTLELVEAGFEFLEGPVWIPDEEVLRFTDLRARVIYEHSPATGTTTPFVLASDAQPNGLTLDIDGHLVACEQATRRVTRRVVDDIDEVLADNYLGLALNSPNDAVVHPNGTIYFTDPPYGGNPRELEFDGVYRIDPSGELSLVERAIPSPNGIVLSPDHTFLYVSYTPTADIWRYPVRPDGSTQAAEWFANVGSTADGMTIDAAGNLYATSSQGVVVLDPTGTPWGTIALPELPANCTFGGPDRRTLYITARTSLYAIALNVPGLPPP